MSKNISLRTPPHKAPKRVVLVCRKGCQHGHGDRTVALRQQKRQLREWAKRRVLPPVQIKFVQLEHEEESKLLVNLKSADIVVAINLNGLGTGRGLLDLINLSRRTTTRLVAIDDRFDTAAPDWLTRLVFLRRSRLASA